MSGIWNETKRRPTSESNFTIDNEQSVTWKSSSVHHSFIWLSSLSAHTAIATLKAHTRRASQSHWKSSSSDSLSIWGNFQVCKLLSRKTSLRGSLDMSRAYIIRALSGHHQWVHSEEKNQKIVHMVSNDERFKTSFQLFFSVLCYVDQTTND